MARIRTIKPEFFTSEDIVGMTPLARLFYVSLWCEADREGRFEWKPGTFKMRYFPGDNCDINALATELIDKGLVVLFSANGKNYAEIPTFTEHQVINNRETESSIPARTQSIAQDPIERVPSGINLTQSTRETVIARDGKKCVRCGSTDDLTVDQIFPQCIGGNHALKNLRCLCRSCNSSRPVSGDRLIADLAIDGLTLDDMDAYCFDASSRVKEESKRVKAEGKEGREGKGKERASDASSAPPPFDPIEELKTRGVPDQLARDWLKIRKAKRCPLTLTGLSETIASADSLHMPLSQAVTICCKRGWAGFEASWIRPEDLTGAPPKMKRGEDYL